MSPEALKSPTATEPPVEKIRPRSRSTTPEKPRPPPVTQSKPKVPPPKPPRVKPRTHTGAAHLSGDQREGQTPTPPTARDETHSDQQPIVKKVEKAPVGQELPPKDKEPPSKDKEPPLKDKEPPPKDKETPSKDTQPSVKIEVTPVAATANQQPVSDAKVSNITV